MTNFKIECFKIFRYQTCLKGLWSKLAFSLVEMSSKWGWGHASSTCQVTQRNF